MQATSHPLNGDRLRILVIDHHEVSRAACAALLRTEGLDVVDVAGASGLVDRTRTWMPQLALIHVSAPALVRQAIWQLRSLAQAPATVLTSSAPRGQLPPGLAELPFLPKADICAWSILAAAALGPDDRRSAWSLSDRYVHLAIQRDRPGLASGCADTADRAGRNRPLGPGSLLRSWP